MFRDSFLVPAEALRLAALGMLGEQPRRYGELANEIRLFASRIAGPSLELMGTSIELLRYERLIESDAGAAIEDNPLLRLTPSGQDMLLALLHAPLKAPGSQFNRLFLALKLRFLHVLPAAEQRHQIGLVADWYRGEAERLAELRRHPAANSPLFLTWLDQEATQIEARLAWLADAGAAVTARPPD
jgi:Putative AphA-like transcriptional regulator